MDKHVIVRGDRSGVFFGVLVKREGQVVTLKNARKLFYLEGAGAVEQIALDGVSKPDACQFTVTVEEIIVLDTIQILPCTEKSIESIKGVKEWKF